MPDYKSEIFALNPKMEVKDLTLPGKIQIRIIDDIFLTPELIKEAAPETNEMNLQEQYPGRQLQITPEDDARFILPFVNLIPWNNYAKLKSFNADFSVFTAHQEKEAGLHYLAAPHVDSVEDMVAMVVYFSNTENCHGGTAFYRNTKHGICTFTAEQSHALGGIQALYSKDEMVKDCVRQGDNNWQLLKMVPMQFNRAILYPGNVFHSIYYNETSAFENERRLTLNLFMDFYLDEYQ